jgi:secreted trypsin-like serine protease
MSRLSFFSGALLTCGCTLASALHAQSVQPDGMERGVSAYLVGGDSVPVQPWIAAFVYRAEAGSNRTDLQRQFCGGTLIASEWVLTAAHCVDRLHPHEMQLVMGRSALADETRGAVFEAADIVIHPEFEPDSLRNDIALVRLATPSAAQPLPLADQGAREQLTNRLLDVYGWGQLFNPSSVGCKVEFAEGEHNPSGFTCGVATYRSNERPASLMHTQLTLHDYATCNQRYRDYVESVGLSVPPSATPGGINANSPVLCAWDKEETSTICYGDSGGPLVGNINGRPHLVGLSSFMQRGGCELSYQLSFFTEVGAYAEFITAAQQSDPSVSFYTQCPGRPRAVVERAAPTSGQAGEVTLRWGTIRNAQSYTLHVVPVPLDDQGPRQLRLNASTTSYSTTLGSGQRLLVSVQAHAPFCDGPMSTAVEVTAL